MYNAVLSKKIFDQLMNGRIVNKTIIGNSDAFVENPLFTEIIDNLADYRQQYKMAGYDFVENAQYFYIRDRASDKNELKTDITMKACVLLLLMGKYLTENNYRISKLTDPNGGLLEADFEAIQDMPDTAEILEKSGMKRSFSQSVDITLVERNIMLQKTSSNAFILSDSGRAFFDEIIDSYQVSIS